MSTRRDAPRQWTAFAPGPLRKGHKAALKKIWDERPCLPSVASRKAWASARGVDPTFVNRWFYAQVRKARVSGSELDAENEGYDLGVEDGRPVEGLIPITPLWWDSARHSTTPEGLPKLSCYEYSTSSETGLRIPLGPGQSSSPIFGSSFYSPKLILDSPPGAYGHLPGPERFLFTPPSPPKRKRTTQSRNHNQYSVEELRTWIHQSISPLPVSPTRSNRLPPLPPTPKKPRPSRGSHDILNFRVQDDPTPSPTPMPSGYSVPYHFGSRVREGDDKPNLSTLPDPRTIVAKTSCPTDQKQGGCIGEDQSLNHRDNQTTTPFPKCLQMMSALRTITQTITPPISLPRPSVDGYIACTGDLPIHPDPLFPRRIIAFGGFVGPEFWFWREKLSFE